MNKKLNLIFDLDGTLIDSSQGVVESANYALAQISLPPQPAEAITKHIGSPLSIMFAEFTDHPYEELLDHFRIRAATAVVQAATPLTGVEKTLQLLHNEGYQMGIATTKIRSQLDDIIIKLKWSDFFRAVSGGDEVTHVKPAPDIFRLTLDRMNIQSSDSIVIGDTSNDVIGARKAGMKVIAVPSDFGDPTQLEQSSPDYVIKQFYDLPELLIEISTDSR